MARRKEPIKMDEQTRRSLEEGIRRRREARREEKRLAEEILSYVRDRLIVFMPYFNRAILKMPVVFFEKTWKNYELPKGLGTNGQVILAAPDAVIEAYRRSPAFLFRVYLHMLFHCIFQHPFAYDKMNTEIWDLAADLAVENAILSLKWADAALSDDGQRKMLLDTFFSQPEERTAENLYHYFYLHPDQAEKAMGYKDLFALDFHQLWLSPGEDGEDGPGMEREGGGNKEAGEEWSRLGRSLRLDMEVFSKNQGKFAGTAAENLREALQEKRSYAEFLRKFAVCREEIRVNPDEFDYIYYSYGLHLYRNMPLIEPLEYREVNKIHDFVIALDTSGSCQGRTVRSFLRRTFEILQNENSFFRKVNVHILQCDAKIQEDTVLTCEEDFARYMQNVTIHGAGGTDFRPVFQYVDELRMAGKIRNLQGLLYFTDGFGTFPSHMPDYRTAFIFLRNRRTELPKIPPWAMKLVLRESDF